MVGRYEIVEILARRKRVETMVMNVARQALSPELKDLAQMVYLILLEYDEGKLLDLWENEQIDYFIARIIINQFRSENSPFHATFRKYQDMIDEEKSISLGDDDDFDKFKRELNDE